MGRAQRGRASSRARARLRGRLRRAARRASPRAGHRASRRAAAARVQEGVDRWTFRYLWARGGTGRRGRLFRERAGGGYGFNARNDEAKLDDSGFVLEWPEPRRREPLRGMPGEAGARRPLHVIVQRQIVGGWP